MNVSFPITAKALSPHPAWGRADIDNELSFGLDGMHAVPVTKSDRLSVLIRIIEVAGPTGKLQAIMLTSPGAAVLVNGIPALSVCRLHDRDEISLASAETARIYFSTDTRVRVEPFPGSTKPVFCARTKACIEPGTPAVQCTCGLWYLQTDEIQAYTYASTCLCGRPTVLDYAWTPPPLGTSTDFTVRAFKEKMESLRLKRVV